MPKQIQTESPENIPMPRSLSDLGNRSENSAGRGQILSILQGNSCSIAQKSGGIWTVQMELQQIYPKSDRLLGPKPKRKKPHTAWRSRLRTDITAQEKTAQGTASCIGRGFIDFFIQLYLLLLRQFPTAAIVFAQTHPAPVVAAPLATKAVGTGVFLGRFSHNQACL
jgi:hypothetical protein